jgi:hypothetical protein
MGNRRDFTLFHNELRRLTARFQAGQKSLFNLRNQLKNKEFPWRQRPHFPIPAAINQRLFI